MQYTTPSHSLATPADARGSLSVGAVYYRDGALESFSSYGPTNDGRRKPDLLGPDGVSVATYAPEAFFGTSAAAPHLTGAAALIWQANPGFDPDSVRAFLIGNAVPVGGSDELAEAMGAGIPRLPSPVEQAPVGTLRPTVTASVTPATATGTSTGAVAAICLVGIGGVAIISVLAIWQRGSSRRRLLAMPATKNRAATIACVSCGALARSGAQFCGQCGRAIDAAASRECAQCRQRLRPGAAYCSNCSASV
jgi:hypothetical protein